MHSQSVMLMNWSGWKTNFLYTSPIFCQKSVKADSLYMKKLERKQIRARFHQLLLRFQEVTWHLILVYQQCYSCCLVDTPNFQYSFSWLYVCMTLHIYQSFMMVFTSRKIKISPSLKFLLVFVHFFLSWRDWKNYFLQRHQN